MNPVPVFVPKDPAALSVLTGSAIIGGRMTDDGRRIIYFEGNKHGAVNLNRFVERCLCAYGRMAQNYPTSAVMSVFPDKDLIQVGEYDPAACVVSVNPDELVRLAVWLRLPDGVKPEELVYQNPLLVRDVEHFKQLCDGDEHKDFFIVLAGGSARSSKSVKWDGEEFCINNEIDGSHQDLKPEELDTRSNIGEAIKKRAFYYVLDVAWGVGY